MIVRPPVLVSEIEALTADKNPLFCGPIDIARHTVHSCWGTDCDLSGLAAMKTG